MNDKATIEQITEEIIEFTGTSPENSLRRPATANSATATEWNLPAWDRPLIGVAAGDDPLFEQIAQDVGFSYWTPIEVYQRAFPQDAATTPEELSVVCWVLPQTTTTKQAQGRSALYPAENWVRARIHGEQFNDALRRRVVAFLTETGCNTVAPVLSEGWGIRSDGTYGYQSTWSERHCAYVAGLGTFGLCDGLITPLGKAVRLGSVVTKAHLPRTERRYSGIHDYCLFFAEETCGKCVERCPAGALSTDGHDKKACNAYIGGPVTANSGELYDLGRGGCGLCQAAVPCESGIPVRRYR